MLDPNRLGGPVWGCSLPFTSLYLFLLFPFRAEKKVKFITRKLDCDRSIRLRRCRLFANSSSARCRLPLPAAVQATLFPVPVLVLLPSPARVLELCIYFRTARVHIQYREVQSGRRRLVL
jgi:hypothetical protein